MKAHFEMFAAYNAWANRRLYEAAAEMDDEARKAPAGAFFGSLHGTLNHLLAADQIWMKRFEGDGPAPTALDEQPFDDFGPLRASRESLDGRMARFVDAQTEETLAGEVTYTTITGPKNVTQPLAEALSHVFNHQTHHRGQCHHMLTAAGRDAPPLDLLFWMRERG
ncbi:MAG: DinB family protein [Pseudomonadota bacterium]